MTYQIQKLLQLQTTLSEIATELYGDLYVCEDEFWNSPTEKQLRKVTNKLLDLGYEPKPTKIQKVCARIIRKSKKLK